MLGIVYWVGTDFAGSIPQSSSTAIKVATSGGTVIGQVGFGWLADVVGKLKDLRLLPSQQEASEPKTQR